jgi:hypothetical protein
VASNFVSFELAAFVVAAFTGSGLVTVSDGVSAANANAAVIRTTHININVICNRFITTCSLFINLHFAIGVPEYQRQQNHL